MLSYRLLKNHGGIMLIGDYGTLKVLHEVIHDVNERSPLIRDVEGFFIGLAYDVRKAFERQREIIEPPRNFEEQGVQYGVKILWPVLLAQHRILRTSLAFIDSGKKHQAITYALEWVIENALQDDFEGLAPLIKDRWLQLDPQSPVLEEKIGSRAAQFCAWSKSERKRYMVNLLESLSSLYSLIYKMREKSGEVGMISPEQYDEWIGQECPDPKV
ncbi:DUF6904 family protein [Sideroxyarcus sp. TK5]